MAEQTESLDPARLEAPTRVLIVAAPFYRGIADALIAGARAALDAAGVHHELVEVPGALEVPVAMRLASQSGDFDGFVALGCVIRGETTHYETVCAESARGLTLLGIEGLCIGNGILTVETTAQANVRADPAGANKGGGAAEAALHLIAIARAYRRPARQVPDPGTRLAGGPGGSVA